MEVLEEKPITVYDAKKELESIKKRDGELGQRAAKAEEHLQGVAVLDRSKAKELYESIAKLEIPRLREHHICKIIDILPKTEEELKAVLQGYALTLSADSVKKIVEEVNKRVGSTS